VTKREFVRRVAERTQISETEAGRAVDAVLETIEDVLTRGGEVSFTGFGKFSVAERGARAGVNPQSGERIQIAASKVPRFSAGAKLKRLVRSLPGEGDEPYDSLPEDADEASAWLPGDSDEEYGPA
jgi:DNA-binding protein HU-beta